MKKNSLLMILYELLGLIVPLVLTPYLSRKLGAAGVGLYSYSYSIVLYFVIFIQLGVKLYGKREVAKVNDNKEGYSSVFCEIFSLQVFSFLIVCIIYAGFISIGIKDESIKKALILQGIELIVGLLDISWFLFGLEKFKAVVLRNCIVRISEVGLVYLLIHNSNDAYIYIVIMAISNLAGVLSMWLEVKRSVVIVFPGWNRLKPHVLPLLQLFIPVLSTQIFSIVDKTIIGIFLDVEHVGYYENAYKIAKVPIVFVTAIGNVMLPRMTKLIADGEISSSQLYMRKSMSIIVMMTTAISFGLASVSNLFMPLYLGPGFNESIGLLEILAFMLIFIGWGNVLRTQYMLPAGYDGLYTKSVVFAAVSNVIISVALVRPFGTYGVAIASLVSEAIICVYSTIKLRKELPIKIYIKDNFGYIISGFIMFCMVRLINSKVYIANNILLLGIEIISGGFVYLGVIILAEKYKSNKIIIPEVKRILQKL